MKFCIILRRRSEGGADSACAPSCKNMGINVIVAFLKNDRILLLCLSNQTHCSKNIHLNSTKVYVEEKCTNLLKNY